MENNEISLLFLEGLIDLKCLSLLPDLVDDMEENLSITVEKFLGNKIIKPFNLDEKRFLELAKNSSKFHYDKKSKHIMFKKKADMNVIIVNNFDLNNHYNEELKENSNKQFQTNNNIQNLTSTDVNNKTSFEDKLIEEKIQNLKNAVLLSCKIITKENEKDEIILNLINTGKSYGNFSTFLEIVEFSKTLNSFKLIFTDEISSSQCFSFFEDLLNEGYFKRFSNSDISFKMSGESFKKRVSRISKLSLNTTDQIKLVKYILNNPETFSINDFVLKHNKTAESKLISYERKKLNPNVVYNYDSKNHKVKKSLFENIDPNLLSSNTRSNTIEKSKKSMLLNENSNQKTYKNNKFDINSEISNFNKNNNKENEYGSISKLDNKNSLSFKNSTDFIPKNHRFSCDYIDHNNSNILLKNVPIQKNINIIYRYSNEEILNIFNKIKLNSIKGIEEKSAIVDEEISFEIGIPIPKTIEHYREKKNKEIVDEKQYCKFSINEKNYSDYKNRKNTYYKKENNTYKTSVNEDFNVRKQRLNSTQYDYYDSYNRTKFYKTKNK